VQTGTVSVDLHFEDTVSYLNKIIGSDLYTVLRSFPQFLRVIFGHCLLIRFDHLFEIIVYLPSTIIPCWRPITFVAE
jgi:hypothetical protein